MAINAVVSATKQPKVANPRMRQCFGIETTPTVDTAEEMPLEILGRSSVVLYADYDHCLHSCDAYVTAASIVPSNPATTFFEFAGVLENLLAPYPALRIILSTSWVETLGFEPARDILPLSSLRARVVGSTFNPEEDRLQTWRGIPRGQQVRRHVRRHEIKKWLALDDMREGFEGVEGHLVHCQPGVGLGDKDVQKLFADRLATMFGAAGLAPESGMPWVPADGDRR